METLEVFSQPFLFFEYIGIEIIKKPKSKIYKAFYKIYNYLIFVFIFCYSPFSLIIDLSKKFEWCKYSIDSAVLIAFTGVSTFKYAYFSIKRPKILKVLKIFKDFELRSKHNIFEQRFLIVFVTNSKAIFKVIYIIIELFSITLMVFSIDIKEDDPLMSQYFPFNWKQSKVLYFIMIVYQYIVCWVHITWSLLFDGLTA